MTIEERQHRLPMIYQTADGPQQAGNRIMVPHNSLPFASARKQDVS